MQKYVLTAGIGVSFFPVTVSKTRNLDRTVIMGMVRMNP